MTDVSAAAPISCTPTGLGLDRQQEAAEIALRHNPLNHPHAHRLRTLRPDFQPTAENIAVMTTRYWKSGGVALTVGFLDGPEQALRDRILLHMNAWASACGRTANIVFTESRVDPQVRIARAETGHWSYIGTDILLIDKDKPTMNLQAFTMDTPDAEFHRVVRHETGHTLGCPHEHMRADLVALIDPDKAIAWYGATQGWSPDQTREQVLTPLDDAMLWKTSASDGNSIMCYQIPAALTKNGVAITGGTDIDPSDADFIAMVYPGAPHAAAAPVASADVADASGHGGIVLRLPSGATLRLAPEVTQAQLTTVLAALKG